MKAINLTKIMDSCCVTIDEDYYEELHDLIIELDLDLNTINMDNLVINGIQFLSKDECNEEHCILKESYEGFYIIDLNQA
tara:strand:+ start:2626 stop:2865 length:240 start_codon:yes stop_codon:yes gene_type:complete